ncbi:MarR family transcriptional regulator [Gordonia sp. HY002]|uniref:MarR family winged helix-turn-helix transcriptional regulator n=1 Tax=Gordonia zhenghanii TaxID=2911516 RepID=UPI001EF150E0|nr:MarR family transcriptional regulator [Gordonia zhenghanii]MCF8571263.1 MarR family transcriptional regulator [Gordonia zhenghanii]MCF8601787.1 MarR family transcriptional regulator [Gordonia zhenghanii]
MADRNDAWFIAGEVRVVFSRLRRRFREVAAFDELTPSQTVVVSRLAGSEMSSSDLADAERVRPQSMAATVTVLTERGLVERAPDPNDGRRQVLSLSAQGRALVDGTRRTRDEWLAHAVDERLTETERETLAAALPLLDRLAD